MITLVQTVKGHACPWMYMQKLKLKMCREMVEAVSGMPLHMSEHFHA